MCYYAERVNERQTQEQPNQQPSSEDVTAIAAPSSLASVIAKLTALCVRDEYPVEQALAKLREVAKEQDLDLHDFILEIVEYTQHMLMDIDEVLSFYDEPEPITPLTAEQKAEWGIGTPEALELARRLNKVLPSDNDQSLTWRTAHLLETYPPEEEGDPMEIIRQFQREQAEREAMEEVDGQA
jgi:hypothetical protein